MARIDDIEIGGKEYNPVRFRLSGEESESRKMMGLGRRILGDLKRQMQLGELTQLSTRPIKMDNGGIIQAHSRFGEDGMPDMDEVWIFSPRKQAAGRRKVIGFVVNVYRETTQWYNRVYVKGVSDESGQWLQIQTGIPDSEVGVAEDIEPGEIEGTQEAKNTIETADIVDYAWLVFPGYVHRDNYTETWDYSKNGQIFVPPETCTIAWDSTYDRTSQVVSDALSPGAIRRNKFKHISGMAKPDVAPTKIFVEKTGMDAFISVIPLNVTYELDEAWKANYTVNRDYTYYMEQHYDASLACFNAGYPPTDLTFPESDLEVVNPYPYDHTVINETPEYDQFKTKADVKYGDYVVQVRTQFMSEFTKIPLRAYLISQDENGQLYVDEFEHTFDVKPGDPDYFATEELHIRVGTIINASYGEAISYKELENKIPFSD